MRVTTSVPRERGGLITPWSYAILPVFTDRYKYMQKGQWTRCQDAGRLLANVEEPVACRRRQAAGVVPVHGQRGEKVVEQNGYDDLHENLTTATRQPNDVHEEDPP